MSELAGGGVATVTSSFAPILAERSTLHASAFLLPFAFALTTAAAFPASLRVPTLLPEPFRSVLVNFSFLPFAGGIPSAVALHSTTVTALVSWAGLSVPVHDGEAWVSFLPTLFVHFNPSPFGELIGVDELETKLRVIREVIGRIVRPCVVFTIGDRVQLPTLAVLSQPC